MKLLRHLPNTITCGNLFCGCLALVSAFNGNLEWTAYFVGIAAILDFFDGFAARMLKVTSAIGKDLDSLADMVTFGVVPGVVVFQMINLAIVKGSVSGSWTLETLWTGYHSAANISYLAFSITVFSCLRLAKFNNDTRQTESFIGLNTPATSMFICSLPLILESQPGSFAWLLSPLLLVIMAFVFSFLLISELPLFSLKFKNFGWKGNGLRYVLLSSSVLLLFTLGVVAIPLIIILYLLLSIVDNIFLKKRV